MYSDIHCTYHVQSCVTLLYGDIHCTYHVQSCVTLLYGDIHCVTLLYSDIYTVLTTYSHVSHCVHAAQAVYVQSCVTLCTCSTDRQYTYLRSSSLRAVLGWNLSINSANINRNGMIKLRATITI